MRARGKLEREREEDRKRRDAHSSRIETGCSLTARIVSGHLELLTARYYFPLSNFRPCFRAHPLASTVLSLYRARLPPCTPTLPLSQEEDRIVTITYHDSLLHGDAHGSPNPAERRCVSDRSPRALFFPPTWIFLPSCRSLSDRLGATPLSSHAAGNFDSAARERCVGSTGI